MVGAAFCSPKSRCQDPANSCARIPNPCARTSKSSYHDPKSLHQNPPNPPCQDSPNSSVRTPQTLIDKTQTQVPKPQYQDPKPSCQDPPNPAPRPPKPPRQARPPRRDAQGWVIDSCHSNTFPADEYSWSVFPGTLLRVLAINYSWNSRQNANSSGSGIRNGLLQAWHRAPRCPHAVLGAESSGKGRKTWVPPFIFIRDTGTPTAWSWPPS